MHTSFSLLYQLCWNAKQFLSRFLAETCKHFTFVIVTIVFRGKCPQVLVGLQYKPVFFTPWCMKGPLTGWLTHVVGCNQLGLVSKEKIEKHQCVLPIGGCFLMKLWFYLCARRMCNVWKVELTLLMHDCRNFLALFPITETFAWGLFRKIWFSLLEQHFRSFIASDVQKDVRFSV